MKKLPSVQEMTVLNLLASNPSGLTARDIYACLPWSHQTVRHVLHRLQRHRTWVKRTHLKGCLYLYEVATEGIRSLILAMRETGVL